MTDLLWLIPVAPLASFLILTVMGTSISRRGVAILGVGSVGLSALISILVSGDFYLFPPAGAAATSLLWTWINVDGFHPQIAFRLDALSLTMILVITLVGFLIHLYSVEFMADTDGFSRFFAYMNLFISAMTTLVLADNLLLLYLGWEGVGLCSYLLIGFWYRNPKNGRAAQKAFIVTRVGDTALIVGLLLLVDQLGTLQLHGILQKAAETWPLGSPYAVAASALLLCGAIGKSAQLPLQTWLPDAMAGPTPVSALIHAATMVTAGVYLIARTHILFELAPPVQAAVAMIGAATLLLAGFSALTQSDIKKILAYSTMSQIGYMFVALGVGAWTAAIFHFMAHAFFKALLFLSAGAVIQALQEEHNVFKMGGLRKELPLTFWTFLAGALTLAGLPLVTSGFYSKGLIIWQTWASQKGGLGLWLAAVAGALLSSLYIFRLTFLVFLGQVKMTVKKRPGAIIHIPLIALAFLSIVTGFINLPPSIGNVRIFSHFLQTALPQVHLVHRGRMTELTSEGIAFFASSLGAILAYLLYRNNRRLAEALTLSSMAQLIGGFWFAGWGFDWLYDRMIVRPVVWIAQVNRDDVMDGLFSGIAALTKLSYQGLSLTVNGRLRWYATWIAAGSVALIGMVLLR